MKFSSMALTTLAASLLLVSGSALAGNMKGEANYKDMAAPCPAPKVLKDGFYLGGQVGYDSYRIKQNWGGGEPASFNPALNATGWVGGLFVGYGQVFNSYYYLGGEFFGNYSGAQESYNVTDGADSLNSKVTVRGSYGLAVLPGIKLNDATLGYVRLGYNWASIKNQVSVTGATPATGSKTNTEGGFNFGVGMETLVYENWSTRAEYSHTNYNSFSNGSLKTSPSDNQFMLGLLYHFA